jgi:penicillin-binding protein 1A
MRISRGRRGDKERFSYLERWTNWKKRAAPASGKADSGTKNALTTDQTPGRITVAQDTGDAKGSPPPKKTPGQKPKKKKQKKSLAWRVVRNLIIVVLFMATLGTGAALQMLQVYIKELPAPEVLEQYRPMLISRLYSSGRILIGEYARERRKLIAIEEMPEAMPQALVAREDKNFYTHFGVDPEGIVRAMLTNLQTGRIRQGGSTITQQLVKNLTNERERAYERKIKEALLALKVERSYSKDEILEMYLNQVYFGHGCYGIGSAAEHYFGKEVKDLTLAECALLAGLVQRPARYTPFRNYDRALIRRNSVLRRMFEDGYITWQEYEETIEEPILLTRERSRRAQKNLAPHFYEYVRISLQEPEGGVSGAGVPFYPLENPAVNAVSHKKLYTDGLVIETTLDYHMQELARDALRKGLHRVEQERRKHPSHWGEPSDRVEVETELKSGGVYNAKIVSRPSPGSIEIELPEVPEEDGRYLVAIDPEQTWLDDFGVLKEDYWLQVVARQDAETGGWKFVPAEESHVQGCLIALDVDSGKILAMVGGYDYFENQPGAKIIFPVQAALQPGSCFKPILYANALSRGLTPADTVDELPLEYTFRDKVWHIENFESTPWNPSLHGTTPLRRALIKSMNVASVHVWNEVTNDNKYATVSRFARENMGIRSPVRPERASALGVSEMYPIELAAVFASFANGGRRIRPYAVERVTDHYGNVLARQLPYSDAILRDPRRSAQVAFQMTHMLRGVIEDPEGTANKYVQELYPGGFSFPAAGKTGTTNACTDAWFSGYSPRIACVVWVGFERKKSLGVKMTGGNVSFPIWAEFMTQAVPYDKDRRAIENPDAKLRDDFTVPPGIEFVSVCKKSGGLANAWCREGGRAHQEAFIEGTAPEKYCTYHGPAEMEAYEEFMKEYISRSHYLSSRR